MKYLPDRAMLRKELLALVRDRRTLLLAGVFALLFLAVFSTARSERDAAAARRAQAESQTRQQWDQQGDRHPHRGAHFGLYVFAPVSVLASFDPGLSRYLGEALWLEPHRRNILRFSSAESDVVSLRLGELSPAYLFAGVLPLLIFGLTFNAVTQERESGTLRMSFGAGMRRRDFILSKMLALALLPTVAVVAGFGLVLGLAAQGSHQAGAVPRALFLMGAVLAYALMLTALGLGVSAWSRTSQQALAVLVALWIVFTFVVPRGAAALAGTLLPLPSAEQFWTDIKRDYENGLPGDGSLAERGKRFDAALLKRYGVARLEDLPVGGYAVRRLERDAYADKVHALHFDRLWQRYAEQETLMLAAGALSPTVALRLASMKFAGTDIAHRKHFEDAAERYRRYVNTAIDQWDIAHTRGLRSFEDKYADNALWQSIARFDYRPPSAGAALRMAAGPLLLLAAWLALALALTCIAARGVKP